MTINLALVNKYLLDNGKEAKDLPDFVIKTHPETGEDYIIKWPFNDLPSPTAEDLIQYYDDVAYDAENFAKESRNELKRIRYAQESDPLFFKWQSGECSKQDWLDKRQQ